MCTLKNCSSHQRWNRVSGSRVTGSPGQQFGSGLGRVTGRSPGPDFDLDSCSMLSKLVSKV